MQWHSCIVSPTRVPHGDTISGARIAVAFESDRGCQQIRPRAKLEERL